MTIYSKNKPPQKKYPADVKILYNHKPHRLKEFDYKFNYQYHFVICTADHQPKTNNYPLSEIKLNYENEPYTELTDFGKICEQCISDIPNHYPYAKAEMYCIMPNHIHLLLSFEGEIDENRKSALQIIDSLKCIISKKIGFSIWQKSYYDTVGTNEKAYYKMQEYISENPAKWYYGKHDEIQDW